MPEFKVFISVIQAYCARIRKEFQMCLKIHGVGICINYNFHCTFQTRLIPWNYSLWLSLYIWNYGCRYQSRFFLLSSKWCKMALLKILKMVQVEIQKYFMILSWNSRRRFKLSTLSMEFELHISNSKNFFQFLHTLLVWHVKFWIHHYFAGVFSCFS